MLAHPRGGYGTGAFKGSVFALECVGQTAVSFTEVEVEVEEGAGVGSASHLLQLRPLCPSSRQFHAKIWGSPQRLRAIQRDEPSDWTTRHLSRFVLFVPTTESAPRLR